MRAWRLFLLRMVAAYVRHAPPHPGQWRLAHLAVQWAPLLKTARRPRIVRLREGFRLLVDGKSQTGRIAYATGGYEPRTTKIMQALVHPGDTVIDVGANIGYFSIVAARAAGKIGRVLAFEPVPDVRQSLIANLRLNHLEHVSVRSEALSAASGEATFYLGPQQDTGLGSLRALAEGREMRVQQMRFDDLWDRQTRVALVKIDVEGAEHQVLQGMTDCLAGDRPDILLEVTDEYLRGLGSSAQTLFAFLTSRGYSMYEIPDEGPLIPVRTTADLAKCPSQFNALCTVKADLNEQL